MRKFERKIERTFAAVFAVLAIGSLVGVLLGYHHQIVLMAMSSIIALVYWQESKIT